MPFLLEVTLILKASCHELQYLGKLLWKSQAEESPKTGHFDINSQSPTASVLSRPMYPSDPETWEAASAQVVFCFPPKARPSPAQWRTKPHCSIIPASPTPLPMSWLVFHDASFIFCFFFLRGITEWVPTVRHSNVKSQITVLRRSASVCLPALGKSHLISSSKRGTGGNKEKPSTAQFYLHPLSQK